MKYRYTHTKHKIKNLKPKKLIIRRPLFWITLICVIIIITTVCVVFFFPKFQIEKIEISGNEKIKTDDVKNIALTDINKSIFSKNIFMANTNNIILDLLRTFPDIENVQIQKSWFQGINLTIKERTPFAIFCVEKCFLMDDNGIIFESSENVPQDMFVVNVENNTEPIIGQNVVDKNIIDMIYKIKKNLHDNFQIDINKVLASNPLIVTTSENWQVYFDQHSNIDTQIMKMNALLKNEISETARKNLRYIYLQYQDRAYYK